MGDGGGEHLGAAGELVVFEDAQRSVPHDGAGVRDDVAVTRGGLGTDVEDAVVRPDFVDRDAVGARERRDFVGDDDVHGQRDFRAARGHHVHDRLRFDHEFGFGERLADALARGEQTGVGDAAADDELVDLLGERLEDGELGRDLGAANDGHERTLGMFEGAREGLDFGGHEKPGAGHGSETGDAHRARFRPVRSAEGVVHIDVAQGSVLACEFLVVLLLADVAAHVFEQHYFARLNGEAAIDPVLDERYRTAEEFGEPLRDGSE